MKRVLTLLQAVLTVLTMAAAEQKDYKESAEYLTLRDSVHHAFNDGDSARFFHHVAHLEDYLQKQKDDHAYYTQRCNEIVFQLNRERIFEAYKLATQLSKELTEKKLDKEMYMAINMMGHIYRFSGNKESAKQCFWEVIHRMEQNGYTESQPPIYMNLVNIMMDEDPQEALRLIDKAASIARQSSPERVFDIEARRTLAYYLMNDTTRFLAGYKAYKEGMAQGLSSVHGRRIEVYYQALRGNTDKAIELAAEAGDDPYETQADIYARAGRWKEAYKSLQLGAAESDSLNSVILSGSMQGIQNELQVYESKRQAGRLWFYGLITTVSLLLLLVAALVHIVQSRRRHLKEISKAYQQVLEADKVKTDFIMNVSHEVRTPLNIISGFAQVLAAPGYELAPEERRHIADAMMHNTTLITTMINEVLEISRGDAYSMDTEKSLLPCNDTLRKIIDDFEKRTSTDPSIIHFETSLADDFTFETNERMLQSIFNPLLDNAVKYLPKEQGTVRVKAGTTASQLVVAIEDNGKGVPAEEAEHIFERFVKLDVFKEGLGLGLTFCRTMVHRLGGNIQLDTTYNQPGARFVVSLPLSPKS